MTCRKINEAGQVVHMIRPHNYETSLSEGNGSAYDIILHIVVPLVDDAI